MSSSSGGAIADILVKLKINVDGFKSGMSQANQAVEYARVNLGHLNIAGGQGIALFSRFGITMGELAQVAGLFLVVNQMRSLVMTGHQFNVQLEQMVLGIKSVVSANSQVTSAQGEQITGADKLRMAGDAVGIQISKMKTDALMTTATLKQIVEAFQAAVPPATAIGLSLDDTRKITVALVQAAGAIGLPMEQVSTETREILSGTINVHTRLGKVLGLSSELVNKWKLQGTFVKELMTRLEAFTVAGKEAGDTWVGVTSSLQDFREQLTGAAVNPAVEIIRKQLISIRDSLGSVQNGIFVFRQEVKDTVEGVSEFFITVVRAGQSLVSFGVDTAKAAMSTVHWLNTVTGGAAGWAAQLLLLMAAGNLTMGIMIKLGQVVGIVGSAMFSASGGGRLLKILLDSIAASSAVAAAATTGGVSLAANMTALMSGVSVAQLAGAKSAAFMAQNMTSLMSASSKTTQSLTFLQTIVASLTTKWKALYETMKLLPGLLVSISTWLFTTPAGWIAIATAVGLAAVGYAAFKLISRDMRTEQEKMAESMTKLVDKSVEVREAAVGRLETARTLIETLKSQATSEMDAQEAVTGAAGSFEELIPLLGQEKLNRAEVIALMERQIPLLKDGEVSARNAVVQAISTQVKEMQKNIDLKRQEIAEQQRLIGLAGGPKNAPDNVKKLITAQKELIALEAQRIVQAKKGIEELAAPALTARKAEETSRESKARSAKDEAVHKEQLAVQLRDIALSEASLGQKKEFGFVTEVEFLKQTMSLRRQKHEAETIADAQELQIQLALYAKEGKKADEVETLKLHHKTKMADKEAELSRESLKNETQLALATIALIDTVSAARLKAAQAEMTVRQAQLDAAKTLGDLTSEQAVKQQQAIDRQKSDAELQRLQEQLHVAIGAEKKRAIELDITRLQADRQSKEIAHEAALEKIQRDRAMKAIDNAATARGYGIKIEQEQLRGQRASDAASGDEAGRARTKQEKENAQTFVQSEKDRSEAIIRTYEWMSKLKVPGYYGSTDNAQAAFEREGKAFDRNYAAGQRRIAALEQARIVPETELDRAQAALGNAASELDALHETIADRKENWKKEEDALKIKIWDDEYWLQKKAIAANTAPVRDTSKEEEAADKRKAQLLEEIQLAKNLTHVTTKASGDASHARDVFFDANSELVAQTKTVQDAVTKQFSTMTEMVPQIKAVARAEYNGFVARSGNALLDHFNAGMKLKALENEEKATSGAQAKAEAAMRRDIAIGAQAAKNAEALTEQRTKDQVEALFGFEAQIAQTAKESEAKDAAYKKVVEAENAIVALKSAQILKETKAQAALAYSQALSGVAAKKSNAAVDKRFAQMEKEYILSQKQADLDEQNASKLAELAQEDIQGRIDAEQSKLGMVKSGTEAAIAIEEKVAGLRNELKVKEISGVKEVTEAHIKAAETRYRNAADYLKKQLDLEATMRSSSLESLDLIQKYKLAQKLGVDMLKLPDKLDTMSTEDRAKAMKDVRSEQINPGDWSDLFDKARSQFGGELKSGIGQTQSISTLETLIKGLESYSKMSSSQMQLGLPLGDVLQGTVNRTPVDLQEGFGKELEKVDAFSKMKDAATLGFEAIATSSQAMFTKIASQGEAFQKEFMVGKLPDLVFENVYAKMVQRLEQEFART